MRIFLTIICIILTTIIFAQNNTKLIINNKLESFNGIELETYIKYVTIKDIYGYKTYSNYQLEKLNYVIEYITKDDEIEFEIASDDMGLFNVILFYNNELILNTTTEEYIHYTQ